MKKIIILLSALAAMVSCQKEGLNNNGTSNPDGNIVVFYAETSKISIGEKEGDKIPLLWEEGDALDIYSADLSEQLGTATLSSGAGEKSASFTFSGTIADNTDVVLVYPAGSGNIIPKEQNEAEIHGCASTTVTGGQASFALQHPAYVKFALGSEAMGGWKVKEILFDCYKVPLSGTYAYSSNAFAPETEVSITGSTDGGFKVTLDKPELLSSNPEVLAAAIPAVLTGKTVFVTLKLEKDGQETVVSKKISGKELKANAINTIKWQDVNHVYTDLTNAVIFKVWGASETIEQLYPMYTQRRKGKECNTFGTGNGIFLSSTYGVDCTAYGDVQLGSNHPTGEDGEMKYALATPSDSHLAFSPAYQDDAIVMHIPVSHIDANKTLCFEVGLMGSNENSPNKWIAEYSFDNGEWAAFETNPTISISGSKNVGKGVYTKANQVLNTEINNAILNIRLRAEGNGTVVSGSTSGTRTMRLIFHKDNKATDGGPKIYIK